MISQNLTEDSVSVFCDNETYLAEVAFCLEQSLVWFLGRGSFKGSIKKTHSKMDNGMTLILKSSHTNKNRFVLGSANFLGQLIVAKYLPTSIYTDELWKIEDSFDFVEIDNIQVHLGKNETSFVLLDYANTGHTVSQLSFDMADLFTVLLLNCNNIRYQISGGLIQVVFDRSFKDHNEVKEYISEKMSYEANGKINSLLETISCE